MLTVITTTRPNQRFHESSQLNSRSLQLALAVSRYSLLYTVSPWYHFTFTEDQKFLRKPQDVPLVIQLHQVTNCWMMQQCRSRRIPASFGIPACCETRTYLDPIRRSTAIHWAIAVGSNFLSPSVAPWYQCGGISFSFHPSHPAGKEVELVAAEETRKRCHPKKKWPKGNSPGRK